MEIHELYSSRISLCANFLYIYSVNVYTTTPSGLPLDRLYKLRLSPQKTRIMDRRTLAMQYFPDRDPVEAVRSLRRMIANCPQLVAALDALGEHWKKKQLTVRQVRLIKDYLGDP